MPQHSPTSRFITTPIYYVNDRPHIGHAYTTTLCDVWARAMRFAGKDVFFLTGTDEHGVKVEKSAAARGISPQALADENAAEFRRVLGLFGLTNDDFIRTTEARHERQVQALVERLLASGDVYLGEFEGWYDEGQEEYHTETKAKELEYKSPISGRPLVRAKEQNYYFRLSTYQSFLEEHFAQHPEFVRPEGRRNEVIGRLRGGLQDVPITRTNFTWGIPMPGDPKHVIYVWIDALLNYVTALGLGETANDPTRAARQKYWPAAFHVIGKEILWFHAVIWPALLKALGLPMPECIYAHSFWISEGQKMSKSLGNFIDLETIERYHATYSLDAWRWYMVTQGPLEATDADFSAKHFHEIYTSDLVNTFANCASRVSAMIGKYFDGVLPEDESGVIAGRDWSAIVDEASSRSIDAYASFRLHDAGSSAMSIVRAVDLFVNDTQPFKIAKEPTRTRELATILARCAEALRVASALLWPIMPAKVEEFWRAYGIACDPKAGGLAQVVRWGHAAASSPGAARRKVEKCALFMRVDPTAGVAGS